MYGCIVIIFAILKYTKIYDFINVWYCIFQSVAVWTVVKHMSTSADGPTLSSKEKFKKAVKEYGSTVIVFHVTISLLSLGACYLLVSGYVIFNNTYLTLFMKLH